MRTVSAKLVPETPSKIRMGLKMWSALIDLNYIVIPNVRLPIPYGVYHHRLLYAIRDPKTKWGIYHLQGRGSEKLGLNNSENNSQRIGSLNLN